MKSLALALSLTVLTLPAAARILSSEAPAPWCHRPEVAPATPSAHAAAPADETASPDTAQARVELCHVEGNGDSHTIEVAEAAVEAHLNHGDTLGPCTECVPVDPADCVCPLVIDPVECDQGIFQNPCLAACVCATNCEPA